MLPVLPVVPEVEVPEVLLVVDVVLVVLVLLVVEVLFVVDVADVLEVFAVVAVVDVVVPDEVCVVDVFGGGYAFVVVFVTGYGEQQAQCQQPSGQVYFEIFHGIVCFVYVGTAANRTRCCG